MNSGNDKKIGVTNYFNYGTEDILQKNNEYSAGHYRKNPEVRFPAPQPKRVHMYRQVDELVEENTTLKEAHLRSLLM